MASCQRMEPISSVAVHTNRKFKIFPNPSYGYLMLPIEIEKSNILVYNSMGQLIKLKLDKNILDITEQPSGIYYIKTNTEGSINIYKVIKL